MSKKAKAPDACYGTPNQIAELMKRGMTNNLLLDFFKFGKIKGALVITTFKGYEKNIASVSELNKLKKKECVFLHEKGKCSLREEGITIAGCKGTNKVEKSSEWIFGVENKMNVNLRKRWLKPLGIAIVKLFSELTSENEREPENSEHKSIQ